MSKLVLFKRLICLTIRLMRRLFFENEAFKEFIDWATEDKKLVARIVKLLTEARQTPVEGLANQNC